MTDSQSGDTSLLDPKLLRLLDVLYTTRSVTRTAELLGQSQPTVSIWLSKLRAQMGDPLFVRTPSGMQPTPQADALMATVREVLDGLRRLAESPAVFDAAQAQRRFVIGMTDASHITLLPHLLAQVHALAPRVVLVASSVHGALAQSLLNGEVDLALGYLPWLDTGIYQQTLYEQDWICLANARHPRIASAAARPLEPAGLPGRSPHWHPLWHRAATAGKRTAHAARHTPGAPGAAGLFGLASDSVQ
jgi:DNA-binding transcriptional LysR family regulator